MGSEVTILKQGAHAESEPNVRTAIQHPNSEAMPTNISVRSAPCRGARLRFKRRSQRLREYGACNLATSQTSTNHHISGTVKPLASTVKLLASTTQNTEI